jgi:hypothetical protein
LNSQFNGAPGPFNICGRNERPEFELVVVPAECDSVNTALSYVKERSCQNTTV